MQGYSVVVAFVTGTGKVMHFTVYCTVPVLYSIYNMFVQCMLVPVPVHARYMSGTGTVQ